MPTSTNVQNLKINKLTEAQYDTAVQGGVIGENELSILTDAEAGQVIQVDTMPTASATEEGKIYQYIGATDVNYTNGYFYKCIEFADSATGEQTYGSGLTNIFVTSVDTFANAFKTGFGVAIFGTVIDFEYDGSSWMVTTEIEGQQESIFDQNIADWAVTFTGTPQNGDTISITYVKAATAYSWENIEVQPAADPLPSQTGNAGKFLTTDGTDASWSDKPLVNKATGTGSLSIDTAIAATQNYCTNIGSFTRGGRNCTKIGYAAGGSSDEPEECVCIGAFSEVIDNASRVTCIGTHSHAGVGGVAIGYRAQANNRNIQLVMNYSGNSPKPNPDIDTVKIANSNGNFEMMSADGTIPTARLTKVNTTITLTSAGWSSNTQTVNVTGMTATGVVFPCPIPADQADYTSAGIICSAQAAGTLTFTCDTVPSGDIDVTVVMM